MIEYRVEWAIDVDATSPEAAAELAEAIMLAPDRIGNIYSVKEHGSDEAKLIEVGPDGVGRFFGGHKHG